MYKNDAILKDVNGNYFDAIRLYEDFITTDLVTFDIFSNLAFIYWEFAADYSFRNTHNIANEWIDLGATKYKETLKKGLITFPNNVELHFLSKYFLHRLGFADFTKEECENIIETYGTEESLVPYFYLYLFDREKYKIQRNSLLKECEELPTTKNKYIKSILTSITF